MSLVDDMIILNAWADAIRKGTHEMSPDGWDIFCTKLDICTEAVLKLADLAREKPSASTAAELPCNVDPLVGDSFMPSDKLPDNIIPFPGLRYSRKEEADILRVLETIRRDCINDARAGAIGPPDNGGSVA